MTVAAVVSSYPDLPKNLTACHALIARQAEELHHASERIDHLEAMVAEQQETIDHLVADNQLLQRSLFGSRRERFTAEDPNQQFLFRILPLKGSSGSEDVIDLETAAPLARRTSRGRQPRVFPDFLPREEQRHCLTEDDIPEEMRDHPNARRFFKKVSEQLELIPMQLKVVEHLQEVIALDQPDETTVMVTAKRPMSLIQCFVGVSVLAYLTVCRFADHLPYYRIEDILGRCGFRIDRSTQWRWMHGIAQAVTPLVELMWQRVRQSTILAVDETPVKELGGPGTTLTGYLWTAVGDADHPYDCFFYTSDRRSIGPETFLHGFQGYLLSDAYVGYERLGTIWPGILLASCWAHARRKFEACHHLGPTPTTHTAMAYFRQIFDLDDRWRHCSNEQRLAHRQQTLRPIVDRFHQWLLAEQARQLPKSKLLGAINYMLSRWESFARFLESPVIPLSNNQAEQTLKYPILGRKAWLFVGNADAGDTAATLFTLTKTCNRLHIDPLAYLQDIYIRLPNTAPADYDELLPDHWIRQHPEHVVQPRVQEAIDRARRVREQRAQRRRFTPTLIE